MCILRCGHVWDYVHMCVCVQFFCECVCVCFKCVNHCTSVCVCVCACVYVCVCVSLSVLSMWPISLVIPIPSPYFSNNAHLIPERSNGKTDTRNLTPALQTPEQTACPLHLN